MRLLYKSTSGGNRPLSYLVFDSRFTNYQNLSKLDKENIKFVTIRRRGSKMLEEIKQDGNFKTVRVEAAGLKKRTLKVRDQKVTLPGYVDEKTRKQKQIRQITITGHGKEKPALIISNDFDLTVEQLVRKYCRRWLVEKGIVEQINFFHLNRVCLSMVIKVDFDLVMSILAHNVYRLLAYNMDRYEHFSDERLYNKFVANNGDISVKDTGIYVELKKKRDLPLIIQMVKNFEQFKYPWLENHKMSFLTVASS